MEELKYPNKTHEKKARRLKEFNISSLAKVL